MLGDIITVIEKLPVPAILVLGGLFFIYLCVVGQGVKGRKLSTKERMWAGLIGSLLLFLGITLFSVALSVIQGSRPLPTLPATGQNEVILSKHAEVFSFDDENTGGWKPLEWDTGWIVYEKSGDIEVVGKDFVLDGHSGPFLKYPLDLESEGLYAFLKRNAIYQPVDDKVIGILANVYYESREEYSFEAIHAGFVVSRRVGEKEVRNEDYAKQLIPDRWNTIVWSLYGPVWWAGEDKSEKWGEFKGLFGDEGGNMWPGALLDQTEIDKIGIQFFLYTDDGPKRFKGTAYIDNIALIYRHVP